jgi:hypothetical protein
MKKFFEILDEFNPCCKKTKNDKTKESNYHNNVYRGRYIATKLKYNISESLDECIYDLKRISISQPKSRSLDKTDSKEFIKKTLISHADPADLKYRSLIDPIRNKNKKNFPIFGKESYNRLTKYIYLTPELSKITILIISIKI